MVGICRAELPWYQQVFARDSFDSRSNIETQKDRDRLTKSSAPRINAEISSLCIYSHGLYFLDIL